MRILAGVTKPPQPPSYTIVAPDPNTYPTILPFLRISSGSWPFNACPQNCTSSNYSNASPSHPLTRKPSRHLPLSLRPSLPSQELESCRPPGLLKHTLPTKGFVNDGSL